MTASYDVAIIGGGPAGMAAAEIAARHGLSALVVDEQQRPGGQFLRQPPKSFRVVNWLPGSVYAAAKAQVERFCNLNTVCWMGGTAVLGVESAEAGFWLDLTSLKGSHRVQARSVLVAAGCYDLPTAFPGWTVPGVLSAGGLQAFIKSQQIVPGERFVLAGTHPLQLLVAQQIIAGGGEVALVAFEQSLLAFMGSSLRHFIALITNLHSVLVAAAAFVKLIRARVPIRFATSIQRVHGETHVVKAILVQGGKDIDVACDRVATCFGFVPQSDIPRALGAKVRWADGAGGWNTDRDEWMRTTIRGVFVAGETTGVAGADAALVEGTLAGLGMTLDAGKITPEEAKTLARPLRSRWRQTHRFASFLQDISSPAGRLSAPLEDDVIVCRCEDVTQSKVAAAMAERPFPDAVKLACRVGMGLCQGRTCEPYIVRMVANVTGEPLGSRGGFMPRFPHRPVAIADLLTRAEDATNFPSERIESDLR